MPDVPLSAQYSRRVLFAPIIFRPCCHGGIICRIGPRSLRKRIAKEHCASQHPLSRQAWAAETRSPHNTIEGILGATRCALDELKAHEYDSYYLGTPYGNTGPDGAGGDISTWDCWHPNGKPKSNGQAYMNCTGFIVAVLEACGANCEPIGSYVGSSGYNRGNSQTCRVGFPTSTTTQNCAHDTKAKKACSPAASCVKATSSSPIRSIRGTPGADCHILFFWGDAPSHDLAWQLVKPCRRRGCRSMPRRHDFPKSHRKMGQRLLAPCTAHKPHHAYASKALCGNLGRDGR